MDKVANASLAYRKEEVPQFEIGDTVDVQVRIKEGEKERIQTFTGVVIGIKGSGISRTFTVRRIVGGEGVERVFPLHSPFVVDVKTRKRARVRRAKLYYLRGRTGRRARMKERIDLRGGKKGRKREAEKALAATADASPEAAEPETNEPETTQASAE